MDEAQTCGKGLADRSTLPASLATFIGALATLLAEHQKSVKGDDPNSARERDAYRSLAERYGNVSRDLEAAAKEMAGYRTMPMAPHDVSVLISPANTGAFDRVVAAERDIARLLSEILSRDEEMLQSMK
jgi:hypothetical protein